MAGAGDASNKRRRTSELEAAPAQTTVVDTASAVFEFTANYDKDLDSSKPIYSDAVSAGGHMWRLRLRYHLMDQDREQLSIILFLVLLSRSSSVNAIFEVVLIDNYGKPVANASETTTHRAESFYARILWLHEPETGTVPAREYVKGGQIKFLCTIRVLRDGSSGIPAPPSDIVRHLGELLDTADGADVSFAVGGETFRAHRALLAARSPVFKAELLGSMAEATMPSIALHDIAPATFKAMLRFMYTDALPGGGEIGDSPHVEMFQRLLAAADRYALDRLKLLCAQKLWDDVSVDTAGDTLACAEMYSCPELKHKCIGFFAVEKNFKKAVLTEGFVRLVQQFPSIIFELRDGAGT